MTDEPCSITVRSLVCPKCQHNSWLDRTADPRSPIVLHNERLKQCARCGARVKIIDPPPEGEVVYLKPGQVMEEVNELKQVEEDS